MGRRGCVRQWFNRRRRAPVPATVLFERGPNDSRLVYRLRESRDGKAQQWRPGLWRKLAPLPALLWAGQGTERLASTYASCPAESAGAPARPAAGTPSLADRAGAPSEAVCPRCAARSRAPTAETNPPRARFPRADKLLVICRLVCSRPRPSAVSRCLEVNSEAYLRRVASSLRSLR